MKESDELGPLRNVLAELRKEGKARGVQHKRSDIDLAVYINAGDEKEAIGTIDAILMASERPVEMLRLDDEEESPFIIQKALKGIPLVEPDMEVLYRVAHRALHEAEGIRYKRNIVLRPS